VIVVEEGRRNKVRETAFLKIIDVTMA